MRKRLGVSVFFLSVYLSGIVQAHDIFVAPGGDDAAMGTREQPVASLGKARDIARTSRKAGESVQIVLRAGIYYLPETLVLTAEDSGTREAPVLWRAADGEVVTVSGGAKLDPKWEPYKDGIIKTQVPAGLATDRLYVNGVLQVLARYPNFDPKVDIFNGHAADCISPARVARWSDPAGGFMHAMHPGEWGGFSYLITGKDEKGGVKYIGGWQGNRAAGPHPQHRFVENIFEELDAPGEWFLNSKSATLYYFPPAGTDMDKAVVEVARLSNLIELRGNEAAPVKWVSFRGITFRHTIRTFMETKEPLLRSDWTIRRGGALFFNGAEDCTLEDCVLDQLGGNAVFVNNYNRRVSVRGCQIDRSGASGVMFVGDPNAVRSPLFEYGQRQPLDKIDRTAGPKSNNYPADCRVEDCLITLAGRIEKQATGVGIDMSARITISHCSIYDMPRAGINIGDGCWGGHIVEFCDIFDTVKETGDHGSFNSWGRDRYWLPDIRAVDKIVAAHPELPLLDVVEPNILRNSRWRCDHGWDIDLDDGSSNFQIYNNLCLNGGIKNREGYKRVCRNNVMVNNSFHPHVWFDKSGDVFSHNIVMSPYQPIGMPRVWGAEVNGNLMHVPGKAAPEPAVALQNASGQDSKSLVADALFVDPEKGDYRVREASPALQLGFENFPMDQFGVISPKLRALARAPVLPIPGARGASHVAAIPRRDSSVWLGAKLKAVSSPGEVSATGLGARTGVLLIDVPERSEAAKAGLHKMDVILGCNGQETKTVLQLFSAISEAGVQGQKLQLKLWQNQQPAELTISDYVYVEIEASADAAFKRIVLKGKAPAAWSVTASETTNNELPATLLDGALAKNYGPIFGNGTTNGMYKLDLQSVRTVMNVDTFTFNHGGNRGRQKFTLYGAITPKDAAKMQSNPGWSVNNAQEFEPIAEVEITAAKTGEFTASRVRRSGGAPLGSYRWLVWAVHPISDTAGGENTSFQEFQVGTDEK